MDQESDSNDHSNPPAIEENNDQSDDSNKCDSRESTSTSEESKPTVPSNEGAEHEKPDLNIAASPPEFSIQKSEIQPLLSQKLRKGDEWYLVDQRWLKQWKKYTGYDSWDQYYAGDESVSPGPVDNSNLFESCEDNTLKDHLMEELDYALLPKPAWEKLTSWYSLKPPSKPICRRVVEYGTYVKHLKVEVYLFNLKVCVHPHTNEDKPAQFSRADTVQCVQVKVREMFQVSEGSEVRLWQRYMTNAYELMKDVNHSLAEVGIYGGQMLMLEVKNKEGKWPRDSTSSSSSTTSYGASSGSNSNSGMGSSYYYDKRQEPSLPGICGLSNLGNTCFMNSALQCLSNTQSLTEYFMGEEGAEKPYKKHINKKNPLGMKGALAETYGDLLQMMWSGDNSYLAPRQFKMMIGKHAPQFSGYQQHDSHELLAFLLDGLHEDLNLVKEKPYVDMDMKTDGRSDKDIAEETWHKYLKRNQSVIVRQFQGQLKSTLFCPKCEKESRIFDPFMYLSLPLPIQKTRSVFVYLVRADPVSEIVRYRLTVPKNGAIQELKQAMQKVANIDPKNLVVIDVYHSRFHRVYYDKDAISQIMDRDDIYLYELLKPLGDQNWVPIPVYMREVRIQKSYSYFSSKSTNTKYGQVFGLPIVVTVPRDGCTYQQLYDAVLKQTNRYVTVPSKKVPEQEDHATSQGQCGDGIEVMECQSVREPEPDPQENENGSGTVESQEDAGNSEEPMETTEGNKESSVEKVKPERLDADTGRDNVEQEEEDESDSDGFLFKLCVVNSYGSQEVQKLKNNEKKLKLTSQTYVSCDWEVDTKEQYYDIKKAEEYIEHESCEEVLEKKKELTIYDCLDLFALKEELGEEDAWYCPHCKDFVQAFKKFDLWKLPDVLVIHLKRFSYSRWWRNKIESKIRFPLVGLDLSSYVVNEDHDKPMYDLFAVSNHFGGLGGGHYTAYCKNKLNSNWYSFDDSHVSETDPNSVCSSSSYVLFYARQSEGRRVRKGVDRSLSVSFDEEVKQGQHKFQEKKDTQSMEVENCIEEEKEGNQEKEENDSVYENV